MQKPSFITVSTAANADIKRRLGFYPGQRAKILVKIPNIFPRFFARFWDFSQNKKPQNTKFSAATASVKFVVVLNWLSISSISTLVSPSAFKASAFARLVVSRLFACKTAIAVFLPCGFAASYCRRRTRRAGLRQ